MKKRISALLLALLMLVPVLASCSDSADTADTTSADTAAVGETTAAEVVGETDRSQVKDNLPDNLDFKGQEIRILHRDDGADLSIEVTAEETGDVVNDAVYNRQMTVEERLNVKLKAIPMTSTIHAPTEVVDAIRKSVTAGSDDYDIALNHMSGTTPLALENMFVDLNSLDYLDFSQPWWAGHFMEQATINDHCYYAAGDMALTLIQSMYLIYYNKDLYANFRDDDIYETVWDGGWTIDKLSELGRTVYTDSNGDSQYDVGDTYGYSTTAIRLIDALLVGADIPLSERDADGTPYLIVGEDERTFDFINKISALLIDKQLTWRVQDNADGEVDMLKKFSEGTLLFIPFTPMGASQLRQMEDDFGVLPMPKLDDSQDEYTTSAHNGFSSITILNTCKYADTAAAVMEAMCSESYRFVTPAYYETALKIKYSRDDETSKMLDMIRDSVKFDFGYIYNASIGTPMTQFRTIVKGSPDTAASTLAANMNTCHAKLAEMLEKYDAMK
nr:extracellular solute-binding protein [Clostridia bacterium]